jgi:hypothetical protein
MSSQSQSYDYSNLLSVMTVNTSNYHITYIQLHLKSTQLHVFFEHSINHGRCFHFQLFTKQMTALCPQMNSLTSTLSFTVKTLSLAIKSFNQLTCNFKYSSFPTCHLSI